MIHQKYLLNTKEGSKGGKEEQKDIRNKQQKGRLEVSHINNYITYYKQTTNRLNVPIKCIDYESVFKKIQLYAV